MKAGKRFSVIIPFVLILSGCSSEQGSRIEGVSDEVYLRGLEFIEFLDSTKMIGQLEGETQLNAIAAEGCPDSDALFEDVIYVLWVYHNLKSIDSAAEELNQTWEKLGLEMTVQQQYVNCREKILSAKTQQDLWDIWDLKI